MFPNVSKELFFFVEENFYNHIIYKICIYDFYKYYQVRAQFNFKKK